MVRLKTFTDVGINGNQIADDRGGTPDVEGGEETVESWELFEGPRYRFGHLLGESAIWSGPPLAWTWDVQQTCPFCRRPVVSVRMKARLKDGTRIDVRTVRPSPLPARALPPHVYCLGCDRSGRDSELGSVTAKPREGRKVYSPDPALKGGVG